MSSAYKTSVSRAPPEAGWTEFIRREESEDVNR
jgi:hypothetical protein